LHRGFVGESEARLRSSIALNAIGDVLADCRQVRVPVARVADDKAYAVVLGMPVDQEIAVGRVLVVAHAGLRESRKGALWRSDASLKP
jgi:hypothetical protein